MNILYVITRSDVIGGASVHVLDLIEGFKKRGWGVLLAAGGRGVLEIKAVERGAVYFPLKWLRREISPIDDFLSFLEIRSLIKNIKPDLVHFHSSKAGIVGRLAAYSLNVPSVFTAHGWAFTEGVSQRKRFFYQMLEKWVAICSDKIIAVSDYDKSLAISCGVAGEDDLVTIHNGVRDPGVFRLPRNGKRIIMVARFDAPKDHLALVNSLHRISDLDWELEFVGDGPLIDSVKMSVGRLGLSDKIFFQGACSDVVSRLAAADIFVLTSRWEGLPLTILEAMSMGLPVIASDVGGVSEAVVHGKTGFLIKNGDQDGLEISLRKLISSENLRDEFGRNGRLRYEEEFSLKKMLNETEDIYHEILEGK